MKVRTRRYAKPEEATIEPGDEIYVPREKMYPDDYSLRITQTEVSIVSAIIGTLLTAITLYFLIKKP